MHEIFIHKLMCIFVLRLSAEDEDEDVDDCDKREIRTKLKEVKKNCNKTGNMTNFNRTVVTTKRTAKWQKSLWARCMPNTFVHRYRHTSLHVSKGKYA